MGVNSKVVVFFGGGLKVFKVLKGFKVLKKDLY